MARIRTVKPELFKHEGLFDAEQETGLPLRLAFIALFTCCDREGRFKWRPRALKLDALPYDDLDFSRVLDALWTRGFVVKYAVDGEEFGFIKSFTRHQVINNRESESELPAPDENSILTPTCTREPRVEHASPTPLQGKGRERKGKEEEGKGKEVAAGPSAPARVATDSPPALTHVPVDGAKTLAADARASPTSETWAAYADAYRRRYGTEPVRNAKVNGQLAQLVARLGAEEAPSVAAFYVGHNGAYYVRKAHAVDALLADAEKLRTEWVTGRRVTATAAWEADRLQEKGDMWRRIIEEEVGHVER